MERMKREARAYALARRDEMSVQERAYRSEKIVKCLTSQACYENAQDLLVYVSFRSEVDTIPLIEKALTQGKKVYVPRVAGQEMDFFEIASLLDLEEGFRGIREPKAHIVQPFSPRRREILLCMPGTAFDRQCHRIGYGGGFYDRYLEGMLQKTERLHTVALAFSCQILEQIPFAAHDIRPKQIITEKEILFEQVSVWAKA